MKVRIATAPCSWGVFYADGGTSSVPYELFLKQASEAGYTEIELGPDGYLPQDSHRLKQELEKYHLTVCAGTATIPFGTLSTEETRAFVTALAKRLVSLGTTDMVVMDGTPYEAEVGRKDSWSPEFWARIYDGILCVNDYLRNQFGIRMVFHPHAGTAIEFTAEIEKMMELGGISLCFDTGHHVYCNGGTAPRDQSALEFLRRYHARIPYLHFKNMDGAVRKQALENGWSVSQAFEHQVMCNLEDGVIDFTELRDVLKEIDFRGTAVIEQDMFNRSGGDAFEAAKLNLRFLRKIGML